MIPNKKKTPEEIAALRKELGILGGPQQGGQEDLPSIGPSPSGSPAKATPPEAEKIAPAPVHEPAQPDESPDSPSGEPVVQLIIPPAPVPEKKTEPVQSHSLRKHELPLAPAPTVTQKTALPTQRHDPKDIAEIRRREALAKFSEMPQDPAIHLKKMTAHPALLAPAYLLALGAALAAWQRAFYLTPIVLLSLSLLLTAFIFIRKKRSRHHAAILTIIIIMTLAFGGLHYAPLLNYGP